jgi:membrane dipeptidase
MATLTLPALAEAGVGLALGTIFAPPAAKRNAEFGYHTQPQAEQMAQAQLDYYHRLADENETIQLVRSQTELATVVKSRDGERPFFGIIPLLKGADPIGEPEAVEMWFERGVRIIGLAWDDTAYASGFLRGSRFGLTKAGHQLLEIMADFGIIADASHLSEKAFFALLDSYPGTLIASQSNARALVPDSERHLSDGQIQALGERGGVIGISPYNPLLRRGQRHGDPKELLVIEDVVAHIDHICQVLGDAAHVGLGSGLGGPFGAADLPTGMDSVLDLAAIGAGLKERGYGEVEITAVLHQNWLRLLQNALPD